jgi:hypothetical protein
MPKAEPSSEKTIKASPAKMIDVPVEEVPTIGGTDRPDFVQADIDRAIEAGFEPVQINAKWRLPHVKPLAYSTEVDRIDRYNSHRAALFLYDLDAKAKVDALVARKKIVEDALTKGNTKDTEVTINVTARWRGGREKQTTEYVFDATDLPKQADVLAKLQQDMAEVATGVTLPAKKLKLEFKAIRTEMMKLNNAALGGQRERLMAAVRKFEARG